MSYLGEPLHAVWIWAAVCSAGRTLGSVRVHVALWTHVSLCEGRISRTRPASAKSKHILFMLPGGLSTPILSRACGQCTGWGACWRPGRLRHCREMGTMSPAESHSPVQGILGNVEIKRGGGVPFWFVSVSLSLCLSLSFSLLDLKLLICPENILPWYWQTQH